MLHAAVETLSAELSVPLVTILMADVEGKGLQAIASKGYPQNFFQSFCPWDTGIIGWAARNRQPALISDVRTVPYYMEVSPNTRSELCVPLLSEAHVIGAINLESPLENAFTQDDLRLLTILANNLVVLIERARLFEEVEAARSELEERAAALETANEQLRELDRIKSQFLANMSHELRTPLNSIIGFSEIILDELTGPINEDQQECVQDIYESGKHLLALINDLLDFSKIEAGRMKLEPSAFEVRELFDELRTTISPLTEKKAQRLSFQMEALSGQLTADRMRLKQVFLNLLSNANKFTPQGGEICACCRQDDPEHLLFLVQDNGIGISLEDQRVIFDEFRQGDGSLTREVDGTGLGLAISKRIIELHHGKIWVESEFGRGATFWVCLPITYEVDLI